MTARDIMTRCVAAAMRGEPGCDVAQQLLAGRYSGLPVIENDGTVVGVVSEFDLLMAVREGKDLESVTAGELMTPVPHCVEEDATLEEIIEKLTLKQVIRLPVTRNGKLVGLISRGDVLAHVVKRDSARI